MFRKVLAFPSWSTTGDFLASPHALNLTAQFIMAQQFCSISGPSIDGSSVRPMDLIEQNLFKAIHPQDGLKFTDGTITPYMLDYSGYYLSSQMDNIMFGNKYESQLGQA
jgi:hypothetical protein